MEIEIRLVCDFLVARLSRSNDESSNRSDDS